MRYHTRGPFSFSTTSVSPRRFQTKRRKLRIRICQKPRDERGVKGIFRAAVVPPESSECTGSIASEPNARAIPNRSALNWGGGCGYRVGRDLELACAANLGNAERGIFYGALPRVVGREIWRHR